MVKIPRVAGRAAIDGCLGRRPNSALGAGGAAKGDNPRRADAFKDGRVAFVFRIGKQPRPVVRREIHRLAAQIFQQKRQAAKRATRQALGDGAARDIFLHQDHGIQGRVDGRDLGKGCVKQLVWRHIAFGDHARQCRCILCQKINHAEPRAKAIADIVAAAIRPVRFACAALMSHSAQGELVCGWRNRDVLPELAIRPKDQNAVVSRHHRHPA